MYELIKSNKTLADIFTARQEYIGKRDKHGRFPHGSAKDVMEAVVSRYLVNNGLLTPSWPDNHRFAACLTHDVDFIHPTWKETFYAAAKCMTALRPKKSLQRIITRMKRETSLSPYCTFDAITKIERVYDGKSSFYFKATSTATPMDRFYDLNDLGDQFVRIIDAGSEVGLHVGYYSYDKLQEVEEEKRRLEKALGRKIVGVRTHCLRFRVPQTWRLLADAGFKYDTSFGYSDMPGFRNGMVHPFKPYDLDSRTEIAILEIPLMVMDKTLMDLGLIRAWEIVNRLIEVADRNEGVITILWHNEKFDEISYGEWTKLYEKILATLRKRKAWMTSAQEICDHWSNL